MRTYHFVDFFKLAVLHLGQEEIHPQRADEAGRRPDVSVLGAPVQGVGVDKVRGGEGGEPGAEEADTRRQAKGVGSQALGGEFAAAEPGVGGDHAVVADDVDNRDADDDFAGPRRAGLVLVDDGDDELGQAAEAHAGEEEDAAAAVFGDDQRVGEDGEDADPDEDAGVHEGVADAGHFEEVGSIGYGEAFVGKST